MKILLSDSFDKSLPAKLARFGEVFDDKGRLAEADVVLIRSKTKATKEYIDSAPNLKLIVRGGVGLDNVDAAHAKSKGIQVMNTPEASSVAVAELAMAFLVALPANLIQAHMSMKEGKWLKKELERTELYQKTLGLLGLGRIGSEVARRAAAFDMQVLAFDPVIQKSDVAKLVPLDTLLAQADYISLHMPHIPKVKPDGTPNANPTEGIINKSTIAKMKSGVAIVNTGRGKSVVEQDLADALASGKVKAYGTDVWFADPPDPSCPLLSAPNVFMAPHIGASSKENLLRIGDVIEKILADFTKEKK